MSMQYIRDTYGVPAKRGGRVKLHRKGGPKTGVIVGSRDGKYLRIRFPDDDTPVTVHPENEYLEYLEAQS